MNCSVSYALLGDGECAEGAADATQHHGSEDQKQRPDTEIWLERTLDECQHDPAESGQAASKDPDVHRHAFDVDARDGGKGAVVGNRAHRLAQPRASEKQRGQRSDHQRDGDCHGLAW